MSSNSQFWVILSALILSNGLRLSDLWPIWVKNSRVNIIILNELRSSKPIVSDIKFWIIFREILSNVWLVRNMTLVSSLRTIESIDIQIALLRSLDSHERAFLLTVGYVSDGPEVSRHSGWRSSLNLQACPFNSQRLNTWLLPVDRKPDRVNREWVTGQVDFRHLPPPLIFTGLILRRLVLEIFVID